MRKSPYALMSQILHDGILYLVQLDNPDLVVGNTNRTGSWADINDSASRDPVRRGIFTLEINHGVHPMLAAYAYSIIPAITLASMPPLTPPSCWRRRLCTRQQIPRSRWDHGRFHPASRPYGSLATS
jgi:hypothetical protein